MTIECYYHQCPSHEYNPIETVVYILSDLIDELQWQGLVQGQVYHVRFMI